MIYLKISNIVFAINYSEYDDVKEDVFINTYLSGNLEEYICEPQNPDYNIKISRGERYIEEGKLVSKFLYCHQVRECTNTVRGIFRYAEPGIAAYCTYVVDIPKDWKNAEFIDYLSKEERLSAKKFPSMFIGLQFYMHGVLLRHNSFLVHGVALQYKKTKGLLFSAASGVGKTTHTTFWAENFGAEILNGDSPIIKLIDGKPFIYGSPWCGTSNITVNKVIQLDAVVIISHGEENKIRKLNKFEALGYFLPHMRRPSWDEESTNICLDYCETIINTISIYKLECLPDSDAAEVARRGISELNEY